MTLFYVKVIDVALKSNQLQDYTQWVKKLIADGSNQITIRQRHIEHDRRWREIELADVRRALLFGSAFSIRSSDETLIWRGNDTRGRLIELLCSLVTEDGVDTLVIKEAYSLRVGAAYQPGIDDEETKKNWLKLHSDYELGPGGKVVKKVTILK